MADVTLPDEFGAIVAPLEGDLPDIGEVETSEAVRRGSADAAAVATYFATLTGGGVPKKLAAKLTRDYAEHRCAMQWEID